MTGITNFIIGIQQITLLNFTLSGDNIGVIALATKNLSLNIAEKARITGAAAADGNMLLIIFGILLNISIIIFGSKQ